MYGNPAVDCDGAQMRALCRQLATVVTVNGDVNDTNVDRISGYAKRFILMEKPFVLDLSGVTSFSTECISLLYSLDEDCAHAGVEWSIVASQPVVGHCGYSASARRSPPQPRSPRRCTTLPTAWANAAGSFHFSPRPPNRKGDHTCLSISAG